MGTPLEHLGRAPLTPDLDPDHRFVCSIHADPTRTLTPVDLGQEVGWQYGGRSQNGDHDVKKG